MGCYATWLGAQTSNREDEGDVPHRIYSYGVERKLLEDFHRERVMAALECKVKLLAFETIPDLAEVQAICKVLQDLDILSKGVDAWITCTCRNEEEIDHGALFSECVKAADECVQVTAVGVNCVEPRLAPALLRTARKHTSKILVCYPNSGERYLNRPL